VTSFSIVGTRGGTGTSTFAWAFAQEFQANAFLDYSNHQSAAWILKSKNVDLSWPNTLENPEKVSVYSQTLEQASQINGIKVFSGGVPLPIDVSDSSLNIVIDGDIMADYRLLHTTNSFQDIETGWAENDFHLIVIRQVKGGIPLKLINSKFNYAYRSERNLEQSIANGFGLPMKSQVSKVAREICADICRDLSNSN